MRERIDNLRNFNQEKEQHMEGFVKAMMLEHQQQIKRRIIAKHEHKDHANFGLAVLINHHTISLLRKLEVCLPFINQDLIYLCSLFISSSFLCI